MKLLFKSILLLFIPLVMAGVISSCSDDDTNGEPRIRYIRVTKPESSDSLLVKAYQGSMVAIMGENLGGVVQVWFNDQRASLSPTYITNTTVITSIPNNIPVNIIDKVKLIFENGRSLEHDFTVEISEPVVNTMKSEYVAANDVAVIRGNYFYEPLKVTFTGGVEGTIVSLEETIIEVRVPEGAQPGPITVTSNFGETVSDFWFRDNRNIFGSMDTPTGGWWHGADKIVAIDPDIPAINNKFLRINRDLVAWDWFEFFVGEGGDMAEATKNIPDEAIQRPEDYYLKFEINTLNSLAGGTINIYIGNNMGGERGNLKYAWTPNVNTGGKWETVVIPFDNVIKGATGLPKPVPSDNGYGISFWFSGPAPVKANFGMDNVRVVPRILE